MVGFNLIRVCYSQKPVIKNKKSGVYYKIGKLNIPLRHLSSDTKKVSNSSVEVASKDEITFSGRIVVARYSSAGYYSVSIAEVLIWRK